MNDNACTPGRQRTRRPYLAMLAVTALVLPPLCGCGNRSQIEKTVVTGVVTFDGEPIERGKIMFYPIEETPGGVSGGIIKEGAYEATGKGGVPVGKHRVEIQGFRPAKPLPDGELGAPDQFLPEKYNRNSELTFEVVSGESRVEKDFDLTP